MAGSMARESGEGHEGAGTMGVALCQSGAWMRLALALPPWDQHVRGDAGKVATNLAQTYAFNR